MTRSVYHTVGSLIVASCQSKVWPVLARMVNDAARHFKQNGEIFGARRLLLSGQIFEGLPPPPDADFKLSFANGSLDEWKEHLFIVSCRIYSLVCMIHI